MGFAGICGILHRGSGLSHYSKSTRRSVTLFCQQGLRQVQSLPVLPHVVHPEDARPRAEPQPVVTTVAGTL